jgi:hypothetical protein
MTQKKEEKISIFLSEDQAVVVKALIERELYNAAFQREKKYEETLFTVLQSFALV